MLWRLEELLRVLTGEPITVAKRFQWKKADNAKAFAAVENDEDVRAIGADFKRVTIQGTTVDQHTVSKGLTIRIDVDSLGLGGAQKAAEDPPPEMMVSFICPTCKQEIEASRDMAGETTACPNCGSPLLVPAESASNTLHAS